MGIKIAVVGATGSLGREILGILAEQGFAAADVQALGVNETLGREVSFGEDDVLTVGAAEKFDFATCAVAILAVSDAIAAKLAPTVARSCVVVDTSGAHRMDPAVPLVVPALSEAALEGWERGRIVACPAAQSAQIALVLAALDEPFGVARVVASTYQSTASTGRDGMDELFRQTRGIYVNEPPASSQKVFTKQIAFNVIPHVDDFLKNGATTAEAAIAAECRRLLGTEVRMHVNCARVPVFVGSAAYVNVELQTVATADKARAVLKSAPGLSVVDHRTDEGYVSPTECSGEDLVYISRLRVDDSVDAGLSFWVVGDDMRMAANTAVATVRAVLDRL